MQYQVYLHLVNHSESETFTVIENDDEFRVNSRGSVFEITKGSHGFDKVKRRLNESEESITVDRIRSAVSNARRLGISRTNPEVRFIHYP